MNDRWTQSTQQSIWLLLVMALLMADQGTKFAFSASLGVGEVVPVTSWLNFVHVHNSGGPFSVLSDAGERRRSNRE